MDVRSISQLQFLHILGWNSLTRMDVYNEFLSSSMSRNPFRIIPLDLGRCTPSPGRPGPMETHGFVPWLVATSLAQRRVKFHSTTSLGLEKKHQGNPFRSCL